MVRTPKIAISFWKLLPEKKGVVFKIKKKLSNYFFSWFIPLRYVEFTIFFTGLLFYFSTRFEVFIKKCLFSDTSSEARMVLQSYGFTRLSLMTSQSFEFWRLFEKCRFPSKVDHSWEKCWFRKNKQSNVQNGHKSSFLHAVNAVFRLGFELNCK